MESSQYLNINHEEQTPRFYKTLSIQQWEDAFTYLLTNPHLTGICAGFKATINDDGDSFINCRFMLHKISGKYMCETIQYYKEGTIKDIKDTGADKVEKDGDIISLHYLYSFLK
jgi:hypothetical protein